MVGRSSRRSGPGWETLPEVWKWSGNPAGVPKVVGDPSEGSEVVGTPPGGPEVVGRPYWRSGSGQEVLPHLRE